MPPTDAPAVSNLRSKRLDRVELLGILEGIVERIREGDSLQGWFEYDFIDPDLPEHECNVRATWKIGNADGSQGQTIMIHSGFDEPAATPPLVELSEAVIEQGVAGPGETS